jgi:uncharacterized protein YndB with AHSA1/START domain
MSGITIERIYNAPRQLVWDAWTTPEHFKKWWGPKIFTCPIAEMDVRVGGKYFWCMRGEGIGNFYTTGTFLEVNPIDSLSYTDSFADAEGNKVGSEYYGMPAIPKESVVTITFEDLGNKTKMTVYHSEIPEGELAEQTKVGWNESFDKMASIVE